MSLTLNFQFVKFKRGTFVVYLKLSISKLKYMFPQNSFFKLIHVLEICHSACSSHNLLYQETKHGHPMLKVSLIKTTPSSAAIFFSGKKGGLLQKYISGINIYYIPISCVKLSIRISNYEQPCALYTHYYSRKY